MLGEGTREVILSGSARNDKPTKGALECVLVYAKMKQSLENNYKN